jgi:vacuolar-type H+-ATPase subunit F/Vma7
VRLIAIGRADDIRGFALAGVETARCESLQEAGALLAQVGVDATVGLIVVPSWVDRGAPAAIARVRARRRAPVVVVLPL